MAPHRLAAALLLVILTVWSIMLLAALGRLRLTDEQAGRVVVLFPPAWEAQALFEKTLRAGGAVIGQTPLAGLWVVYSEQAGFVGRLKAQGAWAVFQPASFTAMTLGGCFATPGIAPKAYPEVRRIAGG